MLKKILLGVVLIILVAGVGFYAWASTTNPIMPEASAALQSDSRVSVTGGNWLVFQPASGQPTTGFIFYPGGKVDYRAYAPYARAVASQGYLVVIAKMPLNLAVFDINAAANVIKAYPQIQRWAVGGHSLGGSMAANFAVKHTGQVDGVVFLASYPASSDSLVNSGMQVVSIFGTNDGLATGPKIDASRPLLPTDARFVAIQGGNHAQFGDYGVQSGDQPASISREAQQAQAVKATVELLQTISGN